MIIEMPSTTTNEVNKRLVKLRDEGGAVALGRVLTLIVGSLFIRETRDHKIDSSEHASP